MSTENGLLEPLSQDKIKYTPKGAAASLKLTEAIDVFVRESETMKNKTERKRRYPKNVENSPWYDLITVKGEISLENHKAIAIDLQLTKIIHGKIIRIDLSGKKKLKPKSSQQLNDVNEMEFSVKLKAGEKRTISYVYETYVRH